MELTLLAVLVFGFAAWAWSESRAAAEHARLIAARACRQAGVQLLDASVSLDRLAWRRDREGRLRVLRRFRYEYSRHGDERLVARLSLLGRNLVEMQAPEPATAPARLT